MNIWLATFITRRQGTCGDVFIRELHTSREMVSCILGQIGGQVFLIDCEIERLSREIGNVGELGGFPAIFGQRMVGQSTIWLLRCQHR